MARKNRDDWVQGPPGSKLKLNNMRGGLGTALLVMEQTLLNVPQGEVDELTATARELALDAVKLVKVRMKDLLRSPKQRAFVKLNDLSSSLIQFVQMYQTFAGYTTRSMEVPVGAVQEALGETGKEIEALDAFLVALDAKIDEAKKQLALTAGESVVDLTDVVELGEADPEEEAKPQNNTEVVKAGHLEYMRRNGYLDEAGKPTGLEPDDDTPDFVRVRLKQIRDEAGDDPGPT